MVFIRTPNQQDLSWFIDMKRQNRLELDPPYQRKSVWTYKDKQYFLDTVLNNYPCPAIYLQKENTPDGPLYNVVDGKQRLSTVLDFFDGNIRLSKSFAIESLQGKKFNDLSEDYKSSFYNYIFMVEQIRSENDIQWSEVFQRVNKNQKTLKEQELRHAKFEGWFIERAEDEALSSIWTTLGVSSKSRASRMKDVEFISVLMLVILENDFVGFPQSRIDELYAKYEFDLDELPQDEAELDLLDESDNNFFGLTKETIESFEVEFKEILNFINDMEEHNQCISNHKRRIFTDLYTLWSVLAFNKNDVMPMGADTVAEKYEKFISLVEECIALVKEGQSTEHLPEQVRIYQANSTGATTEVEPRRRRHKGLLSYVTSN